MLAENLKNPAPAAMLGSSAGLLRCTTQGTRTCLIKVYKLKQDKTENRNIDNMIISKVINYVNLIENISINFTLN